MGKGDILFKNQREHADQGVDPDLGQQAGEDGRHRRGRGVVGRGQPEKQREHRGLDAEGDEEQHADGVDDAVVFGAVEHQREVGHVQRPGDAVEDADGGEEQGRRQEIQRDVLDRAFELGTFAAERQQHKRGHQHHFKPHVKVEQVAGEEGAVDAHHQDVEEHVVAVAFARFVDGGEAVDGHRRAHQAGQDDHDRAEQIEHKGDAERGGPTAELKHEDAAGVDAVEQGEGEREAGGVGDHREPALGGDVPAQQQRQDRGEQGQGHR